MDLVFLIKTVGYFGIFAILFAESGLFIGFFLPGDSLLFTAGFLASQHFLNVWMLCAIAFAGAVLGDSVGYGFGYRVGPKIFTKEDSLLFHRDHLEQSRAFFLKHGKKTIVLARFMPVIRTFAPILAGVGMMHYQTFLAYNVIGGALWSIGLSLLGYWLGSAIPNIDKYLLPIILLIIFLSVLPSIIHILRSKQNRERIISYVKSKI
ncbi:VTT domain-containing protein [Patescibacteria group bacterium]|nr:VTT domain-containing protein [Patescibacteria group bacterium]